MRKHRENVVTEAETDSGGGSWPVWRHASVKTGLWLIDNYVTQTRGLSLSVPVTPGVVGPLMVWSESLVTMGPSVRVTRLTWGPLWWSLGPRCAGVESSAIMSREELGLGQQTQTLWVSLSPAAAHTGDHRPLVMSVPLRSPASQQWHQWHQWPQARRARKSRIMSRNYRDYPDPGMQSLLNAARRYSTSDRLCDDVVYKIWISGTVKAPTVTVA